MSSETARKPADGNELLLAQALRLGSSRLTPNPPGADREVFKSPDTNFGNAPPKARTIAFAGAGGKTTAIFQLARELSQPVLVTTTTHLGEWQIPLADHHIIAQRISDLADREFQGVTLVSGSLQEERIRGLDDDVLLWLHAYTQEHNIPLLIEADGSRQKALKAPNEHEPVIPEFVDTVILMAGLSGLGKPLNAEYTHRPEVFAALSGLPLNDPVTPEALGRVLVHPAGGLKNIPPHARRIVFLNQADTPDLQSVGGKMAASLLGHFDSVIVGNLKNSSFQVFEKTAGIILAAGASTRFGQPKQLLDWRGESFIRAVARTALGAGLSPIVVVTGANAVAVEAAIKDLPVLVARNEDWQSGQASSIRAGLQALLRPDVEKTVGSAVFLLADQPHMTDEVIRTLIEHHTTGLYPIVAPLVMMEQRANPVLFDRVTFPDLMKLEGDIGGRAIFSKYPVEYLPWHDDRLLLDVDKPEDYDRLIEDESL